MRVPQRKLDEVISQLDEATSPMKKANLGSDENGDGSGERPQKRARSSIYASLAKYGIPGFTAERDQ